MGWDTNVMFCFKVVDVAMARTIIYNEEHLAFVLCQFVIHHTHTHCLKSAAVIQAVLLD